MLSGTVSSLLKFDTAQQPQLLGSSMQTQKEGGRDIMEKAIKVQEEAQGQCQFLNRFQFLMFLLNFLLVKQAVEKADGSTSVDRLLGIEK